MDRELEQLYSNYIKHEKINIFNDTVDFIGMNYDISRNNFSFKTYYYPNSCIDDFVETNNPIILYTQSRKMNRFHWRVRDTSSIREYVALFNRSDRNISNLIDFISKKHSFMNENLHEIKNISKLNITDKKGYNLSSLYILGFKNSSTENNDEVIGVEWITRKCPDPDDIGYKYFYDDEYCIDYLKKMDIKEFNFIIDKLKSLDNKNLHYWVFAVDYSMKKNKYKVYLKGEECKNLALGTNILQSLFPMSNTKAIYELNTFLNNHKELFLYGFAICIDTEGNWGINYYFKPISSNKLKKI